MHSAKERLEITNITQIWTLTNTQGITTNANLLDDVTNNLHDLRFLFQQGKLTSGTANLVKNSWLV